MNMNVFNWSFSKHYYFTHPWQWFKELWHNIKAAIHRIRYGWCYMDAYNLYDYLLTVLPQMLRVLANDEDGAYPSVEPFSTPLEWETWLNSMADVFESLQDENWESRNEFAEEFHRLCDECRYVEKDENGAIRVKWKEIDELKEIKELYYARVKELKEERKNLLQDTFKQLALHFDNLWS